MEEHGQIGQLFTTGKEDISSYIHSNSNSVIVAVNNENRVVAVTYITQGQKPFTYNDITKYFKYSEEYKNYVRTLYPDEIHYRKAILDAYELKMDAFKFASEKVKLQYPQYSSIEEFLEDELNIENNHFDEKSPLREKINEYN